MNAKLFRIAVTVVAGVLLVPALTACTTNPVESIIESATGGQVDLGGTSIPDDFPAEVPLFEGEVISAFGVGKDAAKVWTIMLKVPDASAVDEIKSQLEGAGFTQQFDQAAGGMSGAAYQNANYGVAVGVTEDGNGGWAATYIVTPVGS